MIRLAAVLLALPTLAHAEDVLRREWGFPKTDLGPNVVTIERCEEPGCWAVVTFSNTIIGSPGWGLAPHRATLTLDGMDVVIEVTGFENYVADVIRVTPPLGYAVDHDELVVEDETDGQVRILLPLTG